MSTSEQFSQVLQEWVGVAMRRSTVDMMQAMKESGLSMPQLSSLIGLYYRKMCGVSDLGSLLGVTNAAASQMVERLVQLGLLDRTEDPLDRRGKNITLTPKGQELIHKNLDARRKWMEDLTTALTPEEQQSIITALKLLTHAARTLEHQQERKFVAHL
jgi:DNA-binding MarR family transcriptional regulator